MLTTLLHHHRKLEYNTHKKGTGVKSSSESPFANAIVLTGGIATGKSTVAQMFADDGFGIIDADRVAHEVLEREQAQIVAHFGEAMVREGRVDRKALGSVVFADPAKRRLLESILHPQIRKAIYAQAAELEQKGAPYIVDIPLFFETGGYPIEQVVVVYAPRAVQLDRLMQREGYSRQEALKRIEAQIPIDEKRKRATWLIDNSTTREALREAYMRTREQIMKGRV